MPTPPSPSKSCPPVSATACSSAARSAVDLAHAGGHRPGRDLPGAAARLLQLPQPARQAPHRPVRRHPHRPRPHRRRAPAAQRPVARPELRRHLVQRAAQPASVAWPKASRWPRSWAAATRRCRGTSPGRQARVDAGRGRRGGTHRPLGCRGSRCCRPRPNGCSDLYKVWAKELERLRRKERDGAEPEPAVPRGGMPDLQALAARVTPTDKAVPNGSSIAMLLEHKGASVLLGADATPTVMVPALNALVKAPRTSPGR